MIIVQNFLDLYQNVFNRTIEIEPVAQRSMSSMNILTISFLICFCFIGLFCFISSLIRRFRKRGKKVRSKFIRNPNSKLTRVEMTPISTDSTTSQ